jgi:hypothetical protein
MVSTGMIKRAAIRRHLKVAQQLKVGTLILVAVLLLAAYPTYLFLQDLSRDPVLGELDGLNLPGWSAIHHEDGYQGSRWCIGQCRFRERTWASERAPDETNKVYTDALGGAGWRTRTQGVCPPVEEGIATCWQRDQYVLDMWVRAPICDVPPPRPSIKATTKATPTATASAAAPTPTAGTLACPGSLVTVKVFNAVAYHPVG